jgi:thiamine-monophosphate kinase
MDELAIVNSIRRQAGRARGGLVLGIGDDCAIFRPRASEDLLFTTDQMIEGVHFLPSAKPEEVGHRALARSLSDIAAMGGDPNFCLVSLAVSSEKWIAGFFRGLMKLARATGTQLAGGDVSHVTGEAKASRGLKPTLLCDVMVCGSIPRGQSLRRNGARPGNAIYVSGALGRPWDRRIEPRLALGRSLRKRATSCIDLSDGLSLDLHRLCVESGLAAEVDRVPIARGATLERALHGGEDYELLFTLPAGARAPRGTTRIGAIVRGRKGAVRFQGQTLPPAGYNHFLQPHP